MAITAIIRMKGCFSLSPWVITTLNSLRLVKLYSCTLVPVNASYKGMLQACKDMVAYGTVEKEAVEYLLTKRGKTTDGRMLSEVKKPEEIKKLAEAIASGKAPSEVGVDSLFALSPPRGGFGTRKAQLPFGPLGKNPGVGKLIMLMA